MNVLGDSIIGIVMICAIVGAFASIVRPGSQLGKEFEEGLHSIGPIFIPVAGIMASIPYLSAFVSFVFGPIFQSIGADPAIAATSFIAVDMGGYQLAEVLANSKESWIMAMVTGYMAGATIVFSIPVGLAMLEKRDHKYMALGIMSGLLSIPIGVLVSTGIMWISNMSIRSVVSTNAVSDYALSFNMGSVMANLAPIIVLVLLLAAGLRYIPDRMISLFMGFGKFMDSAIRLVLVFSIVEYFTGFFSGRLGAWGFDPIIADKKDQFRALEIAGYIGIMLSGAFPMVYLLRKYMATAMEKIGRKIGLESTGAAGILAAMANILAMFRLIRDMRPQDKVLNFSFAVCAAFLFGDHLAFTANFQPALMGPILIGKFVGGVCAFVIALKLSVPKAKALAAEDSGQA